MKAIASTNCNFYDGSVHCQQDLNSSATFLYIGCCIHHTDCNLWSMCQQCFFLFLFLVFDSIQARIFETDGTRVILCA